MWTLSNKKSQYELGTSCSRSPTVCTFSFWLDKVFYIWVKIGQIECIVSVAPCFRLQNCHRPSNSWVVHFQAVDLFHRWLFWNIFWGIYKGSEILISTEKGLGKNFKIRAFKISAILNSNLITIVTNENCTDSSTRSTAFEASLIFILKRK